MIPLYNIKEELCCILNMQKTIYKTYFKQILTLNAKLWNLTNSNERKIEQVVI